MDAVVLANYANQHAPFAIKALRAGKHVFSEVLPVQTMKEAVELIEEVEKSDLIYAYGENYCYMPATWEMKKLYNAGKIGELEYAECEYIHNCEDIWPNIAYGDPTHWRNNMYSTFYCTHSFGPIIHSTGLRPVRVIGIESTKNSRNDKVGCLGAGVGIEMVTLENGAIVKSIHGNLYNNSIWYAMYGSKGSMESGREITKEPSIEKLYVSADEYESKYDPDFKAYEPKHGIDDEIVSKFGHGGSDYYSMHNFLKKVNGDQEADIIDVYEALDMFLPGMFAFRSILKGSAPMDIPNLRNKEEREAWRCDTACTDPTVAGDMLLPTRFGGTPEIPNEIYDYQKELCKKAFDKDNEYYKLVMGQGIEKQK
jgi:predicted dehydrogenase